MTRGVYQIRCVPTGDSYIGQSIDLLGRKRAHLGQLRIGHHSIPKLQALYDKHGESAFVFDVLELGEPLRVNMIREERSWMERLRPSLNREAPYIRRPSAMAGKPNRWAQLYWRLRREGASSVDAGRIAMETRMRLKRSAPKRPAHPRKPAK